MTAHGELPLITGGRNRCDCIFTCVQMKKKPHYFFNQQLYGHRLDVSPCNKHTGYIVRGNVTQDIPMPFVQKVT